MKDDEFGFDSLAKSFAPEVKQEKRAEAASMSQPTVTQPVAPPPVVPALQAPVVQPSAPTPKPTSNQPRVAKAAPVPALTPEQVAANVPQVPLPPLPPIQNPITQPQFQEAAGTLGLGALGALGAGALGAAAYHGLSKFFGNRVQGEGLRPPANALETQHLDRDWQNILAQSERNRQAKQADAIQRMQAAQTTPPPTAPAPSAPAVTPEVTPSVGEQPNVWSSNRTGQRISINTPPSIQGTLNPENTVKTAPTDNKFILTPQEAVAEIPTITQLTDQVQGKAPVEPPVATEGVPPVATEGKKKGRKEGSKNRTPEQISLEESTKGMNMYRNMFGYDSKNPTSPKSIAAIESTNRFINEAMGGNLPASRDPYLNPPTDLTKAGKKFYSGVPEGYRNAYIPWLQENLHTLPPETQSHVLHSMTKGQTGDLNKIMKGMGLVGLLGATGAAFAGPKETRARDVRNAIGEALLPLGLTPSELQPGTLGEAQLRAFQEAQKLGSPYRSVPPPR